MRGKIPPGFYKSPHTDEICCCQAGAVSCSEACRNSWPQAGDVWQELCVQWRLGEAEGDTGVGPGWGHGRCEGTVAKSAEEEWDWNPDWKSVYVYVLETWELLLLLQVVLPSAVTVGSVILKKMKFGSSQPKWLLQVGLQPTVYWCFEDWPSNVFNFYRWAVSSVMTRQNQIPTEDGSRVTLALIPLWDMCNHTNGLVRISSVLLKGFRA